MKNLSLFIFLWFQPCLGITADQPVLSFKELRQNRDLARLPMPELEEIVKHHLWRLGQSTGGHFIVDAYTLNQNRQRVLDTIEVLETLGGRRMFSNKSFQSIQLGPSFRDVGPDGLIQVDITADFQKIEAFIERQSDVQSEIARGQTELAQIEDRMNAVSRKVGIQFLFAHEADLSQCRDDFTKIKQLIQRGTFRTKYIKTLGFDSGPSRYVNGHLRLARALPIERVESYLNHLPSTKEPLVKKLEAHQVKIKQGLRNLRQKTDNICFIVDADASLTEQQRQFEILEELVTKGLFENFKVKAVGFSVQTEASEDLILLDRNATIGQIETVLKQGDQLKTASCSELLPSTT